MTINYVIAGSNAIWMWISLIQAKDNENVTNRRQVRALVWKMLFWPITLYCILRQIVFYFKG